MIPASADRGRFGGRAGFSVTEIFIALFFVAVVEGATILASDPWHHFQEARNLQRISDINALMNAIFMNAVDHDGTFTCAAGDVPQSPVDMTSKAGGYNIGPCLVNKYLLALPSDPGVRETYYNSKVDYDTGYEILKNPAKRTLIIIAPHAELGDDIQVERPLY